MYVTYVYVYICIYTHTYMHTCIHACIHAYVHTRMHTHYSLRTSQTKYNIHTHTHMYIPTHLWQELEITYDEEDPTVLSKESLEALGEKILSMNWEVGISLFVCIGSEFMCMTWEVCMSICV